MEELQDKITQLSKKLSLSDKETIELQNRVTNITSKFDSLTLEFENSQKLLNGALSERDLWKEKATSSNKLTSKLESTLNSVEKELAFHRSKSTELEKELNQTKIELQKSSDELIASKGIILELEAKIIEFNTKISEYQSSLEQLSKQHKQELQDLQNSKEKELTDLKNYYQGEISLLEHNLRTTSLDSEQRVQSLNKQIKEKHAQELQRLQEEVSRLQKLLTSLKEEKQEMAVAFSDRERELLAGSEQLMKDHESRMKNKLEEMNTFHEDEVKRINKNWQEQMDEMEEVQRLEVQRVRDYYDDQIRAIETSNEQNIQSLKRTMEEELLQVDDSAKNIMKGELARQREELQAASEALLKKKKEEYRNIVDQHKERYAALETKLTKYKKRGEELESRILVLTEDLGRIKGDLESTEENFKSQLAKDGDTHVIEMEELKKRHQIEIAALVESNRGRVDQMYSQMREAQTKHDQQLHVLLEKIDILQDKITNRESRADDLELINQLQSKLVQKERDLSKAIQEMQFFKMELVNREEGYNKVFNRNPNVGVVNPLSFNTKPTGQKSRSKPSSASSSLPPVQLNRPKSGQSFRR
ncbi:hypothetical protein GEMRC1_008237 [Eukaryota sp. GEM-RC1]